MVSNLLTEIQQILEKEDARKGSLPIPNYLFIQQYGRSIVEEMPQIAALLGKRKIIRRIARTQNTLHNQ